MSSMLLVLAVVVAIPGAVTATHLTFLALASLFYRHPRLVSGAGRARFLVLIPAHNEEQVIGATLETIGADLRSGDRILVVADHCTDRTAEIARAHGALVLERGDDEEPGRGPARQAGLAFAADLDWDAVVAIDADSTIEPGYFDACSAMLAVSPSLQTRHEAKLTTSLVGQAPIASHALQSLTIPRGREVLRCSIRLRGSGMVLRRDVAQRVRFRAPASEDLWLGLDLLLEGIRTRHVDDAHLRSENVPSWGVATTQKVRHEAGRIAAAREFVGPLLRARRWSCFEAAWYLVGPPFAIACGSLLLSGMLALLAGALWMAIVASALLVALACDFALALVQSRAPARTWFAVVIAPWYLAWKLIVQLRAAVSVARHEDYYPPTEREPTGTHDRA
jgi:glycosyltransferase involved in cell wall biosynthesis